MALSRRTGQRFQASIWPGFVDAMTGLLLVLMFVLTIFMVIQFVLRETITGQESELDALAAEIVAISEALGLEKAKVVELESDLGIFQLHGKKLSYNNYNDIFAALNISKTLPKNTGAVIIKHANPCGVSITKNKLNSYKEAYACDHISAFGGNVLLNFKVTKKLAIELNKLFLEVINRN